MVEATALRRLSETFDPESRPVFLSLFADLSEPKHRDVLERRAREIEAALEPDLQAGFRRTWESVRKALEENAAKDGTRGVAVFAGPDEGFLEALGLAEPVGTQLILDSSPYVRPLAQYLDAHESFILVLLDTEDAAVFHVNAGKPELMAAPDTQPMPRHKSGGMSQARYQRHRNGVINQFLDEVATEALKVVEETESGRVIVAGPGQGKRLFLDRCPQALAERIIAVEDIDFREEGAKDDVLAKRFVELARTHAREEALQHVRTLRRELRTGERAVTGAFDCIQAAIGGRVQTLIVLRGHRVPGRKCEEHQTAFAPGGTCHCGNEGTTVDAVNECIEFVVRARGAIEFVEGDPFLESVGGCGALLRY